jgi:hypothetical protein
MAERRPTPPPHDLPIRRNERRGTPAHGVPVPVPTSTDRADRGEDTQPIALAPDPADSNADPYRPGHGLDHQFLTAQAIAELVASAAGGSNPLTRKAIAGFGGFIVIAIGLIAPLGESAIGKLMGRDQLDRIEANQALQAKDSAELRRALAAAAGYLEALDGEQARAVSRPPTKMPAALRVLIAQEDLRAEYAAETADGE